MAISLVVVGSFGVAAQTTAPPGQLPPCTAAMRDCVLPAWPDDEAASLPSVFGAIDEGEGTWIADPAGDVAADGLDILAVGVTRVEVTDAKAVRRSDGLLTRGTSKKAVKRGPVLLVRVVLDRPFDDIAADHSGVHLATDVDGSRNNNAPTAADKADGAFAGMQDVYSLGFANTTGKTKLLTSDLAKGWYKSKDFWAASRAAPAVIDFMVRPEGIGEGLRVVTYVSGEGGGYDAVSIGPSDVPVDGRVGLTPVCIEGTITAEPYTVGRLIENGQTLRDIEAPASWHGGATFALNDDERGLMRSLIETRDADGDGRIGIPATIGLFEEGLVIRQRPEIMFALDENRASMAVELGLTKRGFTILRDVVVESTDDAATDALLERMARSLAVVTPPFRSARRSGPVAGEGAGSCAPSLIVPRAVADPNGTPDEAPADIEAGATA